MVAVNWHLSRFIHLVPESGPWHIWRVANKIRPRNRNSAQLDSDFSLPGRWSTFRVGRNSPRRTHRRGRSCPIFGAYRRGRRRRRRSRDIPWTPGPVVPSGDGPTAIGRPPGVAEVVFGGGVPPSPRPASVRPSAAAIRNLHNRFCLITGPRMWDRPGRVIM